MITKIIPVPSSDQKIYRQILGVLNFMINLTNQEADVLAEIVKLNHEYITLPELKRAKFIMSTDSRKDMRTVTKIDEKPFNGIIARLKKKLFMGTPVLSENGVVHPGLLFHPDDEGFKIEVILKKGASIQPSPSEQSVPEGLSEESVKKSVDIAPGRPEEEEEKFEFTILPPNE